MTVLIVLASATIAALVVKVAVDAQGAQQRRAATLQAREEVATLELQVVDDLRSDPMRPFAEVLPWESPRICEGDLSGYPSPVEPGSAWPASCGALWSYAGNADADQGVRLYPPNPRGSSFIVESFARVGNQYAGSRLELLPGGRTRPVLFVDGDVDLDAVVSGVVTVSGPVYTSGSFDPGAASISEGVLLASEDVVSPRPSTPVAVAVPAPGPQPDDVDVRSVYALPLGSSQMQASHETLRLLACLDPAAENVFEFSTGLCLEAGKTLVTVDDDEVVVPAAGAAAAFLLVVSDPGQVTVYQRPTAPVVWPDTLASWGEPLGVFQLPASGVVYSDRDVVLGHCAESSGVCDDWLGDGNPGMTTPDGFTVVVGAAAAPADLYVGGPIHASAAGPAVGASVSGAVRFPAAATPATQALGVDLWLHVLGLEGDVIAGAAADAAAARPSLTVTGALLVPRPSVAVPAFTSVSLQLEGEAALAPPFFPSPGIAFVPDVAAPIVDGDLQLLLPSTATGATVPVAPLRLTAYPGTNGEVSLAWRAPSNGGAAIVDYVVEYSDGGDYTVFDDGLSTSPRVTVTGLESGAAYTFRVTAVNAAGSGVAAVSSPVVLATVPAAPTILSVTPGSTQLSVAFAAPASNGGSPITDYEYTLTEGVSWVSAGTSSPFIITGLSNGTAYQVQLRAVNSVGAGTASAAVSGTPGTAPGPVTSVAALPGAGQAVVSWTAPVSEGSSVITDYTVEFSTASDGPWTAFTDGTSATTGATVTGLSANTRYWFRVSAVNAIGTGSAAVSSTGALTRPTSGAVYSANTGSWYLLVASSSTRASAAAGAAALAAGGQLVSINSAAENSFVQSLITGDVWLGATDEASELTWVHPDGTLLFSAYMNWSVMEPDNFGSAGFPANCLVMMTWGTWRDESCSASVAGYVAEWR